MKLLNILRERRVYLALFFLLLFIAIWFRFEGIVSNSFPFTYDIGRDLIAAREIAFLEKVPLIGPTTGLPGLFYGPSWYYILAVIYLPLGGDPQLMTGFIALTGVVAVVLSFILARKIGGLFFAFVLSGVLAVSPIIFGLTNQIWSPTLIPILWSISFFLLYFIYKKIKVKLSFFALGIVLSLIVDMEIVVGLLYSIGIGLAILISEKKKISIINVGLGVVGFMLVLLPRILFDFRHENLMSKTFFDGVMHMFVDGGEGSSTTPLMSKLTTLFSLWCDTVSHESRPIGAGLLIAVIIGTIIFYKKTKGIVRYFLNLTLVLMGVSIVGLSLFGHDLWGHYLVMLPMLYIFWLSLIATLLYRQKGFHILGMLVGIGLIVLNFYFVIVINAFTKPLWEGNASVYRNQLSVVDEIYMDSGDSKFKFIVYTPPVHAYTYEYLFQWYGPKEYKKLPDEKNAQYLYVILEPDHENPQRQVDWLKIRENDGKIIETINKSGGIVIQKRLLQNSN